MPHIILILQKLEVFLGMDEIARSYRKWDGYISFYKLADYWWPYGWVTLNLPISKCLRMAFIYFQFISMNTQ